MSLRSVFRAPGFLAAAVWAAALAPCLAQEEDGADFAEQIAERVREVFDAGKDAVVKIEARDNQGLLAGTGFFVDPAGTIYTLASIVGASREITVVQGDKRMPATLLVADPRSGVALVKVGSPSPFLPLGHSKSLELAEPVVTIGYPLDLPQTPQFGTISGFDKRHLGKYFATTHIRAAMPLCRGQGGSPVLDLEGKVVGIVVSGIDDGAGCYFLPIEAAEKIREDYVRFGEVRHGWAGVYVEEADEPVHESAARVVKVDEGAPATAAGLQIGDIVKQVGDVEVRTAEDVLDASFHLRAGEEADVLVVRNGQELTLKVRAVNHPAMQPADSDQTVRAGEPLASPASLWQAQP